jgi:hypothetical protein
MKHKNTYVIMLFLTIMTFSCRKPFEPSIVASNVNYLVVEGIIDSGPDSTFIKLSKTVKLSGKVTTSPVLHAVLTVEGDNNESRALTETTNGNYVAADLNLDNTRKYRLRIKTADDEYLSDFVEVLNSPPIDSISYEIQSNGVQIYANTHDSKNKTRYYRWSYGETWIFHSNFQSNFKSNGDTVLGRDMIHDNIYRCWQSDTASTIVLGSSAKLAQDIIVNNPVISLPSTSEKVSDEYSIFLRQYALTKDAYIFWQNLKKNTEQLGSIFDAQPTQINGNIHSVIKPAEPVIGYISVGGTSSQRIFIRTQRLPGWYTTPYYPDCKLVKNCCSYIFRDEDFGPYHNQVNEFINYNRGANPLHALIPINAIGRPGQPPTGYTASSRECADCTLRGTNKQPAFWK